MLSTICKHCRRPYVIRVPTFFPLSYCQCQVKDPQSITVAMKHTFLSFSIHCNGLIMQVNRGPNVNLLISDYTTESESKSGQNISHPQGGDFRDAQE
jgi:hypothetical protein